MNTIFLLNRISFRFIFSCEWAWGRLLQIRRAYFPIPIGFFFSNAWLVRIRKLALQCKCMDGRNTVCRNEAINGKHDRNTYVVNLIQLAVNIVYSFCCSYSFLREVWHCGMIDSKVAYAVLLVIEVYNAWKLIYWNTSQENISLCYALIRKYQRSGGKHCFHLQRWNEAVGKWTFFCMGLGEGLV